MRWLTAQELSKIARKSPDAEKTVPERTIRHMALQRKFSTKKEGKYWLIDPASALRAGLFISPENLEGLQLKNTPDAGRVAASLPARETAAPEKATGDAKKYKKLGELGVYDELKGLYRAKFSETEGPLKEAIKQTLYHLALGFYEYTHINKAEYFKRARKYLVGAIVEDDLTSANRSAWRDQLEDSIMPGIIGLIRKQEGGRRGRGQLKVKGKD